jgi:site-specific DNA recombinase
VHPTSLPTSLDLGDLYQLTEELNASGPVVEWQETLTTMAENKVQGLTIWSDAPDFAHLSAVAG